MRKEERHMIFYTEIFQKCLTNKRPSKDHLQLDDLQGGGILLEVTCLQKTLKITP